MRIDGRWNGKRQPMRATDADDRLVRPVATLRSGITPGGAAGAIRKSGLDVDAVRDGVRRIG